VGKHKIINVGDKFIVKPDEEVTVTAYQDAYNVEVEDCEGNRRVVLAIDLHRGDVLWRTRDGKFKPGAKKLGDSPKVTPRLRMLERIPIGSIWESNNHGKFSIEHIADHTNVTIRWCETGKTQSGISTDAIRKGHVVNKTTEEVLPVGHYVYITSVDGEIVYVGMGKGRRYAHTISGASGNKELNRLYFSGAKMITEIYQQGLSKQEASRLEMSLIAHLKPKCNQRIYDIQEIC
jgi:hypothetical protein